MMAKVDTPKHQTALEDFITGAAFVRILPTVTTSQEDRERAFELALEGQYAAMIQGKAMAPRNGRFLRDRFQKVIAPAILAFQDIERENPQNVNEPPDSWFQRCNLVYRSRNDSHPFPYRHCKEFLRDVPAWRSYGSLVAQRQSKNATVPARKKRKAQDLDLHEGYETSSTCASSSSRRSNSPMSVDPAMAGLPPMARKQPEMRGLKRTIMNCFADVLTYMDEHQIPDPVCPDIQRERRRHRFRKRLRLASENELHWNP